MSTGCKSDSIYVIPYSIVSTFYNHNIDEELPQLPLKVAAIMMGLFRPFGCDKGVATTAFRGWSTGSRMEYFRPFDGEVNPSLWHSGLILLGGNILWQRRTKTIPHGLQFSGFRLFTVILLHCYQTYVLSNLSAIPDRKFPSICSKIKWFIPGNL